MMLKVRFHGTEYYLTEGSTAVEGPLATAEQYTHGLPSFAHLFASGEIKRYGKVIGRREDLEVVETVADLEPGGGSFENLFDLDLWMPSQ